MKVAAIRLLVLLTLLCWSAPSVAAVILSERDWQTLKALARGGSCGARTLSSFPYVVVATDRDCVLLVDSASPVDITLPQAGTAGITAGFGFSIINLNTGVITVTPTVSTIQASADYMIGANSSIHISTDGTNYFVFAGSAASVTPGLDDVIVADRTYGGAVSQATAPRIGDSGSGEYWLLFRDPTGGLIFSCEVSGVLHNCHKGLILLDGKLYQIKNQGGTVVWEIDHTGALTEGSIDVETAGVSVTMPFRWDLDLCGVSPTDGTTTGHVWNRDPLSTAPTLLAAVGTNRGTCKLTFPDSDGDYGVQISRQIPDGTLTGNFAMDVWWDTTGAGNARFQVQTKCYADDEAGDAAFNTASVVTAAAGTSGRPNKVTLSSIDVTGCAGGELMRIRFFRNRTEASDTLNAALNVEKVVFKGRVIE